MHMEMLIKVTGKSYNKISSAITFERGKLIPGPAIKVNFSSPSDSFYYLIFCENIFV